MAVQAVPARRNAPKMPAGWHKATSAVAAECMGTTSKLESLQSALIEQLLWAYLYKRATAARRPSMAELPPCTQCVPSEITFMIWLYFV
jgi:hypothetical protein